MGCKHCGKYLQKYHIFFALTIILSVLYACSTTKKVPEGEYLLTKNSFKFEDKKIFPEEILGYVSQKPNKKQLFLLPISLWLYNQANPKYDTILNDYMTFPSDMRNHKLLDSLFIKYHHPEYVGRSLFFNRIYHNFGTPPVILNPAKTNASSEAIRKYLVFRGYWDAKVSNTEKKDSLTKKAQVTYDITVKKPTYINGYYYNIPDAGIRGIYQNDIKKTAIRDKDILDQTKLEREVKRITDDMRNNGYYNFNESGQEIYFVADTLKSQKQVPLTMEIHKDAENSPYKKTIVDSISVYVLNKRADINTIKKPDTTMLGINFFMQNKDYRPLPLWRAVISKRNEIYNQRNLDQTKSNFYTMNNFSVNEEVRRRPDNDSIIDLRYTLIPLDKYDLRLATDVNYSQILNFGISPSVDLTTRNIFGGAQNLTTSLSGTFGRVSNPKDPSKNVLAYELSAQLSLNFPKLLIPFNYYKFIPKRYSPTSSINIGTSIQNNIGLGRVGFNGGLNYQASVNDIITHRLTLFNTQFSLTKNKGAYYDYFTGERSIVDQVHLAYFQEHPDIEHQYNQQQISFDQVSDMILDDSNFVINYNTASPQNEDIYNSFLQSLLNKDRQTQDVLVSSMIYNFTYNEIGKKDFENPFYLNAKVELAGNLMSIFAKKTTNAGAIEGQSKTIFGIPYSQFVKFDVDVRKYFRFKNNRNTLVLRQLVGVGIPYGNSVNMPFIRSYFNGGSNDIRAWRVFGGLGPADVQLDEKVRSYIMDNVKLTTNIEYRMPINKMWETAAFVDAGNIWSLKDTSGIGDQFTFKKFLSQMGVGAGVGLRINIAYITVRIDAAYKVYDPNQPMGDRWVIKSWKPLQPVVNFAFGYPF